MSHLTDATGRGCRARRRRALGLFTPGGGDRRVYGGELIHVEVDPKEINRLRPAHIGIVADAREMLVALLAGAKGKTWPDRKARQRVIAQTKIDRKKRAADDLARTELPIYPYQAVSAIAVLLPEDTVVIGDGAEAYHWFNEVVRQNRPASYITHGFLGNVGFWMGFRSVRRSRIPTAASCVLRATARSASRSPNSTPWCASIRRLWLSS